MNQVNKLIDHIQFSGRLGSWQSSSYRFLCPYCQPGLKNKKGKLFVPSDAKGYIYKETTNSYDVWMYHCKLTNCVANRARPIKQLIQDYYPELMSHSYDYELAKQIASQANPVEKFNRETIEVYLTEPRIVSSEPVVQKLPRLTPQQQAGKGSKLQKRLNNCRPIAKTWEKDLPEVLYENPMSKKRISFECSETESFWLEIVKKERKMKSTQDLLLALIAEEYRKLNR